MPTDLPFTFTSAMSRTVPRSIHTCCSGLNHAAGAVTVFEYVAVPEKYFTPAALLSVHETSFGIVILAGAPHFGGNVTVHAPSTVPSFVSVSAGAVRSG